MATYCQSLRRILAINFITLLIIILAPLALLAFITPLLIYRWILAKVYTLRNPESAGLLDAQSSVMCTLAGAAGDKISESKGRWFINNENKTSVLLSVIVEGGALNMDAFRTLVSSQILHATHGNGSEALLYPEFQQYPVLWAGYLFWKLDTSFSVDNHIKLYQNADDWDKRDSAFCQRFVHEYRTSVLPANRSPWEVMVVENVRCEFGTPSTPATTLIVFKFPHYFADGHSIFNAIIRLADGGTGSIEKHAHKAPAPFQQLLKCAIYPVKGPYDIVSSQANTKTVAPFERQNQSADEEAAVPEGQRERSVFLSNQFVHLNKLKFIAKKFKVSLTSVVLVCVGRGIRNHLTKCGSSSGGIPAYLRTSFAFPSPHPRSKLMTNDMYIVPLHVPLHDAEFEDQLRQLDAELVRLKGSTIHVTMKLLWTLLGILPPTWTWKYGIFGQFFTFDNLLSVFPGPKQEFKILGRKVTGINYYVDYYYEEGDGVSTPAALALPFTLSILTYGETLQFWTSAAPDIVPQNEIHNLTACIEQEIQSLSPE